MRLYLSDSEKSMKALFDSYFHYLVLHAFKITNDYKQAEEIVQDVFVKIWQNYEQIENVTNIKAYLYKAVHNSSLNYLRHVKVMQKQFFENANPLNDIVNSTEETIIENEKNTQIRNAINKLPDNWRQAILLSKYDNLTYHEIAERMQISHKTVEKYISKALQFLRIELKDLLVTVFLFLEIF